MQASVPRSCKGSGKLMEQGRGAEWLMTGLSSAERGREEYEIHIASRRITVAPDHLGIQWHPRFWQVVLPWHWYNGKMLITDLTAFNGEKQGISKLADAKPDKGFARSDDAATSPLTHSLLSEPATKQFYAENTAYIFLTY